MKAALQIILVILILFCSGCVNMNLAIQEHGPQLAEPLGVAQEDIRLMNFCGVKVANEYTGSISHETTKILALTNHDLFLLDSNIDTAPDDEIVRITLADIDEVALVGPELLMRHERQLLLITLHKKHVFDVDLEKSQELFDILVENGVSGYAATKNNNFNRQRGSQRSYNQRYNTSRIPNSLMPGRSSGSGNNTYIKY
jgi:hypothetical protein